MSKKINFPAFPITPYAGDRDNQPLKGNSGMSIRDWFAGMSLIGLAGEIVEEKTDAAVIADVAYELADAMLERLAK